MKAFRSVEAQFNGNTIYPDKHFVERNQDLDLATFDVPPIFVSSHSRSLVYHTPASWPPAPLSQGELVIYGGYPGALREVSPGKADFAFQSFIWRVTDITDANIVMHVDFPNLFWPNHEEQRMNENVGGVSGGPVFRIIEQLQTPEKRVYLELVGIVYEYHESLQVMRARHIRHVLADGSLMPLS